MSGEYFDDDELIEDAMEEEMEPPLDYEDFVEQEMQLQRPQQSDRTTNTEPPLAPAYEHTTTEAVTEDVQPPPSAAADQEEEPSLQHKLVEKTDLYKFDRYSGRSEWRKKPKQSDDTMVAETWKRGEDSLRNSTVFSRQTTARLQAATPEVQLLGFINKESSKPLCLNRTESRRLKSPKEGINSIPITLGDGSRLFIPSHQTTSQLERGSETGNMLGISIKELFRRSNAILRKAERQKLQQRAIKQTTTTNGSHKETADHSLWVDKHAPTVFSHLLSAERTNREVLRALRGWDPYVFHRDPPPRPAIVQQARDEFLQKQQTPQNDAPAVSNPKDTRPDMSNRVILLSGPPGVGKTTLAHIVARHAGYRPMEINASDERSASVLKERVLRGMESATLNMAKNHVNAPNCLILDEIDGADARGAVATLVELIKEEMPSRSGNNNSRKKKQNPYLRRPIIFICNHKFAPALRPLLPYAMQFDVSPPSPTRLVARLRAVLSQERLNSTGALLHQLVTGTGGDIRSCLYTLQFAAARARELARLSEKDQSHATVEISKALGMALGDTGNGLKDERNDVAGAISAVFRKQKKPRLIDSASSSTSSVGLDRILQSVENFGDNSKTLDCLFTNLLRVSFVDPTLDKCFAAHEWLSSADIYRSQKTSVASNNHMEHHTLQRNYMPAAAAAVHLFCRVETKSDLVFSTRQLTDSRYLLEANEGLVHKFIEGLAPKARTGAVGNNVVTETIPYALWMLSAGEGSSSLDRAVSTLEVLSKHEVIAFQAHVSTLRALGLTYVAEEQQSVDSLSHAKMRLEPEIDRIVKFEEMSEGNLRKQIPSTLKELLAYRASHEKLKERDSALNTDPKHDATGREIAVTGDSSRGGKEPMIVQEGPIAPEKTAKHKICANKNTDPPPKRPKTQSVGVNFLGIGAAKAKAAKTARKAMQVGFDRSKKVKLSNSGSGVEYKNVVRFKFSRGFTQAVRTPCRLEDLK